MVSCASGRARLVLGHVHWVRSYLIHNWSITDINTSQLFAHEMRLHAPIPDVGKPYSLKRLPVHPAKVRTAPTRHMIAARHFFSHNLARWGHRLISPRLTP
jgi:hypothetical protein